MKQVIPSLLLMAVCGAWLNPVVYGDQNVVVVLDDSGSMDERMRTPQGRVRKIDAAKDALIAVLNQLPPDTKVGVLALNSRIDGSNWVVPFAAGNPQAWEQNIRRLRADGGTPLGEFMKVGADELLGERSRQVYGTYRLLIVTDGEANDRKLVDKYLPDILSRGLVVDVIGVDMRSKHSLATRVHNYRSADDNASLQQAISEVFGETVADDQAAEADFEILAALPDGFAEQAIEALAGRGNEPIQAVEASAAGGFNTPGGSTSSGTASSVREFAFGSLFCCFAFVAVIVLAAVAMISKSRR